MLRRRRFNSHFGTEYDPGPVLIQARKVHFETTGRPERTRTEAKVLA